MGNTDEEGGQDKEGGQVDCHDCFKKEIFEEVCSIDNDEDEDGWKVDGEDSIVNSSLQNNFYMNSRPKMVCKILNNFNSLFL